MRTISQLLLTQVEDMQNEQSLTQVLALPLDSDVICNSGEDTRRSYRTEKIRACRLGTGLSLASEKQSQEKGSSQANDYCLHQHK